MIRLLQRMDDSEPRHPVPGDAPTPELRQLTLLADADESPLQALEDWARGLDWVEWLFSSVRQRMTALHFQRSPGSELLKLRIAWENFTHGHLIEACAPHLISAWQTTQENDPESLLRLDQAFSKTLSQDQITRSLEAGRLLLKSTRGARYQGSLGHYRTAVDAGTTPGHFLTAWAAIGHFFQLSLANVIAEYLRLEWSIATRDLPSQPKLENLPQITAKLMQVRQHDLRVVA